MSGKPQDGLPLNNKGSDLPKAVTMQSYRLVRHLATAVTLAWVVAPPAAAGGQGVLDRLKQKAADKKAATTDSIADAATTSAVDKVTGAVKCLVTNVSCIKKAFDSGKHVKLTDQSGDAVSSSDSAKAVSKAGGVPASLAATGDAGAAASDGAPQGAFGDGVFLNYDFVPGDRVIFAEDFTVDQVGDFPKRLELRQGNFEVAKSQGQRFLRTNSAGSVAIPLPEKLPDRFTFEADYIGGTGWAMGVHFVDPDSEDATHASFNPSNGGLEGTTVSSTSDIAQEAIQPITHVAVMAAAKYAKVYINGVRVANVPNAKLGRGHVLVLDFLADETTPAYITNIRVAEGGKPLYDALMADGHVATHGILFATGSDRIRGESKPTLDAIGQMLAAHPELSIGIEGHTDNVGTAASNQTLSDKRAAAVRQFLIANYQVDASRLTSRGFGATKPAAPNNTAEGRQQNRRVELVKP